MLGTCSQTPQVSFFPGGLMMNLCPCLSSERLEAGQGSGARLLQAGKHFPAGTEFRAWSPTLCRHLIRGAPRPAWDLMRLISGAGP